MLSIASLDSFEARVNAWKKSFCVAKDVEDLFRPISAHLPPPISQQHNVGNHGYWMDIQVDAFLRLCGISNCFPDEYFATLTTTTIPTVISAECTDAAELSKDVWSAVFRFFSLTQLIRLRRVCQSWRARVDAMLQIAGQSFQWYLIDASGDPPNWLDVYATVAVVSRKTHQLVRMLQVRKSLIELYNNALTKIDVSKCNIAAELAWAELQRVKRIEVECESLLYNYKVVQADVNTKKQRVRELEMEILPQLDAISRVRGLI